ncbi:threonine-phosphate decarboxylase [Thalassorhabdomicrobium marinisediminis]|uniref:Aminotransferase n=1 Tax=Thalassorhabdomicrobium marinisediminis TaxID=2170577 RepID=A0A2T7FVZ6_9RHOB|nr:threonine-phosphate decarboxylase [Thalassorhabdomicrobium marinisediminis]PVA06345.1 threonine-phosphate decarboxylase [Thalassorhabdomicrobium marinisediminis]
MSKKRDHGGGLDAAVAAFGGTREGWLDLSTGINPVPYPVGRIGAEAWTALPDQAAMDRLLSAARAFWSVPEGAGIVAANGASALIAQMPAVVAQMQGTGAGHPAKDVSIPGPTYNEHAAAFRAQGWQVHPQGPASARVIVHPNNPDGRLGPDEEQAGVTIIDESFCDVTPEASYVGDTDPNRIILKSFGKFWGLAGLRLGFAICAPAVAADLTDRLGPWAVAGPALEIGARALEDHDWAEATRARLAEDAARLDGLLRRSGARVVGGTDLFRLYEVKDAAQAQTHLAEHHVWSRIFPYSRTWLRLGLPAPDRWDQLEAALTGLR